MARIESLRTEQKFKKTEAGEIPVEWEAGILKNFTELITKGATPTTYGYSYTNEGVLFIRIENITEQGQFVLDNAKYISKETNEFLARSRLEAGDILFSIAGALGRVAIIPKGLLPANINQALALIRLKGENLRKEYLKYVLHSELIKGQINLMSVQLAQANFSLQQVGDLKIPVPTYGEQKKIAEILLTVDSAIEKNIQLIEKKKELKKGLMQELLTRGIRHNKFYKTKIGEIPEGWEIAPLGKISTEIYRYPTYYNIQYVEKGIPEIRGELIKPNGTLETNISLYRFISEETAAHFPRTRMQEGDFVVSVRGTMGKVGIVPKSLDGANMTANLIRISPDRNKVYPFWLQQVFLSDKFQERLDTASSSSTIKTIKASELEALNFAVPGLLEQKKIAEILSGVAAEIEAEVNEKSRLEQLKKGLMQALLTGKVRVKI